MNTPVRVVRTDALVDVCFTVPERRNALSMAMLDAVIQAAVDHADANVLVLRGEGDVFSSGFDLDAIREDPAHVESLIERLSHACRALRRCPATTVANVRGAAVAGGCALAVACDILIARRGDKLGYPVHRLGISPAVTLPVLLPAAGGTARSLLQDSRLWSAQRLHESGVVHVLLDEGESADDHIEALCARGTAACHATKAWLNTLEDADVDAHFDGPVEGSRGLRMKL